MGGGGGRGYDEADSGVGGIVECGDEVLMIRGRGCSEEQEVN